MLKHKVSGPTRSRRGDEFLARSFSVVETCRRQGRDALDYLHQAVTAWIDKAVQALARISERDPDDWPALACALLLDCPVWAQDADFFDTGVTTWTTSRVKLYLTAGES